MSDEAGHESRPATYNLLFVCTGNTCRSPMAAAAAEAELARRGWSHVRVASAGIAALPNAPASDHAITVMRTAGSDISSHRARQLTPELVAWADLALAMAPSHLDALARLGAAYKSSLISDFLEGEAAGQSVDDPFGGPLEEYQRTYATLAAAVMNMLDQLAPILAP